MRQSGYEPRYLSSRTNDSPPVGNPAAGFEELAMPLLDSAYNFAYWLARNRDDAEDLVQETYLKAFRSFTSFRSGGNFRAWIFRILKNTFLTRHAKSKRAIEVPMESADMLPELPAKSDTAESVLIGRARLDVIRGAIERLPVPYREVIVLCDVEEASYREIAEILSIPIGTVMSRLARARRAVRMSLTQPEMTLKTQAAHP
jgi:RNA polymerase sigma-70 factor, ECF subfamily